MVGQRIRVLTHHPAGPDVAAVIDQIVDELGGENGVDALGRIVVLVIQIDFFAVDESVADDLGIIGGLVVGAAIHIVQIGEGPGIVESLVEAKRSSGPGAVQPVEVVVGHRVPETDDAHASHAGVARLGEHNIAVGIIGATGEEVVALDHGVIAVAQRQLAVRVEKSVIAIGVLAGFVRADLGLARVLVHSSLDGLDGVVKAVVFDRGVQIDADQGAIADANRLPPVGRLRREGAVGGRIKPGVIAGRHLALAEVVVAHGVVAVVGRVGIALVDHDRRIADGFAAVDQGGVGDQGVVRIEVPPLDLAVLDGVAIAEDEQPCAVVIIVLVIGVVVAAMVELDVRDRHVA